jgi:hypothetical protein
MEGQKISPEGPISSAYKGIEWTPFRAKLLSDFYNRSPIDMQCNQSDGARFPGSWDAMVQTPFPNLPPAMDPNEQCFLTGEGEVGREKRDDDVGDGKSSKTEEEEEKVVEPQNAALEEFLENQLSKINHNNNGGTN